MQPYLKLDHIDKIFTRGNASTEVLKDINLTIEKGEYVSIIGHSGCGKSSWKIAKSIRRARTARWCFRTTACCRG